MATDDKALIASSEFNPDQFLKGFAQMTGAVEKFTKAEEQLKVQLAGLDKELLANKAALKGTQDAIAALDKTSNTYKADLAALNKQQTEQRTAQKATQDQIRATKTELTGTTKTVQEYQRSLQALGATTAQVAGQGRNFRLLDPATLQRQIGLVQQAGQRLRGLFAGGIDDEALTQLEQRLSSTTDEFKQLAEVIAFVKSKLDTLDPNTEAFAELTQVVAAGEEVLENFGRTQEETAKKGQSLRGQLTALRTELVRLEEQGKDNTKEFQDMQLKAGQLQDAISDAQQRIRVLSSDTRGLDFGLGVVRGAAAGYSVFAGVMELAGVKSEDTLQTIARLNAVMATLNGLQELQTLLQKQSVVTIVGQEVATKAAAIAQRIYAVAVGTSTGAMRTFRVALLATGIGAFIVALGLAAEAMGVFDAEVLATTTDVEALNQALEDGMHLFDIRVASIKTQAQIEEEQARRRLTNEAALAGELTAIRLRSLEAERGQIQRQITTIRQTQEDFLNKGLSSPEFIEQSNQQASRLFDRLRDLDAQVTLEREKALTRQLEQQRAAYRAYLDRLLELQRQLRDATLAQQPQDAERIREGFNNTLKDALDALERDVKDDKLTRGRANVLGGLLRQLNKVQTDADLKEFNERVLTAQRDLNEALLDLRFQASRERVDLLRDELTQAAAATQQQARQERSELIRARDALLRDIQATQKEGLISEAAARQNAERVTQVYDLLLENLATRTTRAQEQLAARAFDLAQEGTQRIFAEAGVTLTEAATQEVLALTQRFQTGRISYERYQQELTRIAREETQKRIQTQLAEAEALQRSLLARIAAVERTNALLVRKNQEPNTEEVTRLREQATQLRGTIAELRRQLAAAGVADTTAGQDELDAKLAQLSTYAQAVGNLVSSVVSFWQQANEAEQRSLDRSIRLQERRVDAATRIAERGNAEYLRLEEDRLQELQLKQENAARRQLAINAVLQTSQALTAFVSALAQGIATGGPLGGIAIATAVIGLIASGFAIITNLSANNQQKLYKGKRRVTREHGEPAGRDTVPALLNEGEAVVPTDKNEAYDDTMDAVFTGRVPPEVLNRFVRNYHANLPRVNHERLGAAAEVAATFNGHILEETRTQNRLLREQNERLQGVEDILKGMGVNVNLDKHGLGISMWQAVKRIDIHKKS